MEINRISEIIQNREITDVFYNDRVVWIQELNNDVAKIGFLNGDKDMYVHAKDLSEKSL